MTEIEYAPNTPCLMVCAALSTLLSIIGPGKRCHDNPQAFEPMTLA